MAEAHQPLMAIQRLVQPLFGVLDRADLVELVHDLGRGAAVERAFHRPDRAGHGRREVAAGGRDDAGREGGGVEPMLRADDEIGVQRLGRPGVRPHAVELVQEPFDEIQVRIGLERLKAGPKSREGRQRGRGRGRQLARACSTVGG